MKPNKTTQLFRSSVFGITLLPAVLIGQTTDTADQGLDEEIYLLSPFEVTSSSNSGYTTTETLAGTRIKTDLKDLANSISVVNTQFLKDTGATSSKDLLLYTSNTEVGGVFGNFSGTGGGSSYNENNNLLRPSTNTRVRGLDAADNTRNYFLTETPWDGYNVDRVEMQRGPNSILFGVGSPAGIVNATTKSAIFENQRSAEIRVGEHGSIRGSVDINQELIEDTLAVRLIALDNHTEFQQKPAFEDDQRIFAAVRYLPKLFGENATTSISVNYEHGEIDANRPRSLPPIDAITPWFLTGETDGVPNLNKLTLDPNTTNKQYNNFDGQENNIYPWFREAFLGRIMRANPAGFYDANSDTPQFTMTGVVGQGNGLNGDGVVDGTIDGFEYARPWGIATFSNYAAGAIKGGAYYSNYSISDPSIFDFYHKLIDGDNKREWQNWDTANLSVSQTFMSNRFGFEFSAFTQDYDDGQYGFLNADQYAISVDINTKLADGSDNPNLGRPYVGNSGYYGNAKSIIDRDSVRFTSFVDVRSTDFFEESLLTRILGHHLISGLLARDVRKNDIRGFSRWGLDTDFTDATGDVALLNKQMRSYDWIAYLGDSLIDPSITSASGINLSNVSGRIDPQSTMDVLYFDATWNAPGVAYSDPYTKYSHDKDGNLVGESSTQSENPDNYVGWTTRPFNVLSAENGDIDDLYTSVTKSKNRILSQGLTLQSYMFDDSVVFTYGWRKDKVKTISRQGQASDEHYGSIDPNFDLNEEESNINTIEGQSRTWGVVVHAPDYITKHLPWDMKLSAFYGKGENFKADAPRGDVFGNQIANPTGETEDYGFIVSVLDNKLTLKTTWYETKMAHANLPSSAAGFGSGNIYYVWAVPYWGTTHALAALDGLSDPQKRQGNWGWPWNTYATDGNGNPDESAIFDMVQDFFANIPLDQGFADEYGLGMNIAAMKAAAANGSFDDQSTWQAFYDAVPTYGLNKDTGLYDPVGGLGAGQGLDLQPLYNGNLKSFGSGPVASADTLSKGIEFELNAQVTDNWNVLLNVSKTEATISSVSPEIQEWIDTYTDFINGDAGLIRLWGGDTFRKNWEDHVIRPYETLLAKIGSSASEISPWRLNLVTNYNFSEGYFKGVNVGMAYRWEDKRILGYQYDENTDALDIDKPWKGPTEDHFDLWVGYGRPLTEGINWRIQLNVRNVGEGNHLMPVYIQPNGSTGYSRIAEGTSWFITNTFEF
ncbi:MAG: TonB-dependent receptor plug domain-containing protein [Opitutales bacterium]|nr:TonB-dependent receptor plug domain-containing protein [Opitutales bacterium]